MPGRADLQRLVDEGRFDDLLREVTLAEVARAWMRYQHRFEADGNPGVDDPDWWAVDAWMDDGWWASESRVRDGILELVAAAETDLDFGVLGAAIMEMFIVADDDRLAWLAEQGARSEAFRLSLRNVCVWGVESDAIALRVEAAADAPLPRPTRTLDAEENAALDAASRLRDAAALLRERFQRLDREGH